MTVLHRTLSFWPSHAQFVLYDTHADFSPSPDEEPLWGRPEEAEGALSTRRTEVSVGLFADAEVHVNLDIYPVPPELPEGCWDVTAEARLLVASGELGVRDVVQDVPEVTVDVPPGWIGLRVIGEYAKQQQTFCVQIWPLLGQTD